MNIKIEKYKGIKYVIETNLCNLHMLARCSDSQKLCRRKRGIVPPADAELDLSSAAARRHQYCSHLHSKLVIILLDLKQIA